MTVVDQAVVIGASAGALEALSEILPVLPREYPKAILVVVHLPPVRESLIVQLLQERCALQVCEAEDKDTLQAGTVYIAPPDYHLLVETDKSMSLSSEELVNYSRPSIDVLFISAAEVFGRQLTGVILTGANHDGALGLQAVERAGGMVLVQRPELSVAPQMPHAALDACKTAQALNLAELATRLCEGGHR